MSFQLPQSALPASKLLGYTQVQSAGWRVGCQQHTGVLRILNTIQCQRNIRLYFRFAWKLLKLGLILKALLFKCGGDLFITYKLTNSGDNRLLQLQPDITTSKGKI